MVKQGNNKNSNSNKKVRDRLLDSAEELFCEHGFDGASIRDIAASANCNIASVNYYFGGKENLYVEMFRRHVSKLIGEQITNIQNVMKTEHPTVDQLIRTLVTLALKSLNNNGGKRSLIKMMVREMLHPHLKTDVVFDEVISKFFIELHKAIMKLCPELEPEDGMLCIYFLDGIILHALLFMEFYCEHCPNLKVDDLIEHIVRFSTAGIRAYTEGKTE
ncbi:MAG: TetR family transcriptional regulator [Planctomycetota bacterium]